MADLLAELNKKRQPVNLLAELQSQQSPTIGQQVLGGAENLAALATGAIAEPIAGLAGIAQSINPFAEQGAGAQAVEDVRGALTFQPETQAGQAQQQAIGEALAPIGQALSSTEKFLGENTLKATGSPALATIAHTLPTAALELLGIKGAKKLTGPSGAPTRKQVRKAVVESAPEIDQIKNAARAVYKEIDDAGVSVKESPFKNLVNSIQEKTAKAGRDADVTPRAEGAIRRLNSELGQVKSLGEIDTMRKVAQGVASQLDPTEKALGNIMITEIDDFLDNLKSTDLSGGIAKAAETGKKFKAARKLWGRARRAELIQDAIKTGEARAAGPEAGIRNELNRVLNNKKLNKFFPESEKAVLRDVVTGDFKQNLTRAIGKLGISIDRSPNIIGSLVGGAGAGGIASGFGGSITAPALGVIGVGTASKEIAKRLTRGKAKFTDAIVRAGNDGERIAKAYLSAVPKAKRKASDLADLLADPNVDVNVLESIANKTVQDALDLAKGKRAVNLAAGALTGALAQNRPEEQAGQ